MLVQAFARVMEGTGQVLQSEGSHFWGVDAAFSRRHSSLFRPR